MIDLQVANTAVFDRLKTSADGAAARALLGIGSANHADSVIGAEALQQPLPFRPLAVLRRLPVGGLSDEMRPGMWLWYVYDDPAQGYYRINGVLNALQTLYNQRCIAFGDTFTQLGGEEHDRTLNLLLTIVRVIYTRRG